MKLCLSILLVAGTLLIAPDITSASAEKIVASKLGSDIFVLEQPKLRVWYDGDEQMLLCPRISLCADTPAQPKPEGIFLKKVPADMETRITGGLQKIAKKYTLSQSEKEDVKATVESYDLNVRYNAEQNNKEVETHIKEVGYGAVPAIAEMMSYESPETRLKAIVIMSSFIPPWWNKPSNFADIQATLLPLYVRSAMDTNREIRLLAIGGMETLARTRAFKKIPDEIVSTLKNLALNDPDPKVRWEAQDSRIALGLAPRDAEHRLIRDRW